MHRSDRLTLRDVETAFGIVGECRELWSNPSDWQRHVMARTAAWTGLRVSIVYEMADDPAPPGGGPLERAGVIVTADDCGWETAGERRTLVEGIANRRLSYSPLWTRFVASMKDRSALTVRQSIVIQDRAWQASDFYDRCVRPTRIGHGIMSIVRLPLSGTYSTWCFCNDRHDRALSLRQSRRVGFLHRQIAPLINTRLATWRHRTPDKLSQRRQEVLTQLLDGRSEQQIADAMFRSRAAVHEHVAYLYKHFEVSSRAELSAVFLRRKLIDDKRVSASPYRADDWLTARRR